jgi:HEAT repeat protein
MGFIKRTAPAPKANDASQTNVSQTSVSQDLPSLLAAIKSPELTVRRAAARDLAAYPAAVPQLIEQLTIDANPASYEAILAALTHINTKEAILGLTDCLRSEHAALRIAAVDSLKSLPLSSGSYILDLLHDKDPDVRILAVNILESFRHPESEVWLIDVIKYDAHLNVCGTAVDLLAEIGSDAAIEPLKYLAQRFPHEPYIEFATHTALRRIIEE